MNYETNITDNKCDKCNVLLDECDTCPECGVYHGDACEECGRCGYHAQGCELSEERSEPFIQEVY